MSVLQIYGPATGLSTEAGAFSGGTACSIITADTFSGQPYVIRSNPQTGAQFGGYRVFGMGPKGIFNNPPLNITDSYIRYYFKWKTLPTNLHCGHFLGTDVSDGFKFHCHIDTAGRLVALNGAGAGTILVTMVTALAFNTWYRIEIYVGSGNPGPWAVTYYLGHSTTPIESISGSANVLATGMFQFITGVDINDNSNVVDFYISNILWSDANIFPCPGQSALLIPKSDGFYANGTPNGAATRWQSVNEVPPNDDASYVNNIGSGNAYTVNTSGGLNGTFKAYKLFTRGTADTGSIAPVQGRLRSGTVDTDTTAANEPIGSYQNIQNVFSNDPATGKAWTSQGVNSAQPGIVQGVGAPLRVTSIFGVVDYLPLTPPSPIRKISLSGEIGTGITKPKMPPGIPSRPALQGIIGESRIEDLTAYPNVPQNLTAVGGNGQVLLNWRAAGHASSYNIYRGISMGGESLIPYKTGIKATSFVDVGVTNGTTYFYEVAAVNKNGISGKSNEAYATPSGGNPPATPSGLAVSPI